MPRVLIPQYAVQAVARELKGSGPVLRQIGTMIEQLPVTDRPPACSCRTASVPTAPRR